MQNISPNTLFVGKRFIHLKEVGSTNDFASQLLQKEKLTEGTVIFTDSQTKGKGQFGNHWQSEAGKNIVMSIILYPHFLSIEKQFYLNMAVSLAVTSLLTSLQRREELSVKIKWPNDILINKKKVAGILIENTLNGNKINSSIIGIGINVNQTNFSSEIPNATSLKLVTGRDFDILDLVSKLCEQIEVRYLQLREGKYDLLKSDYLQSLYCYQETHQFKTKDGILLGQILGVTEEGKLIIESDGKMNYFGFKEVVFF